MRVVCIIPRAIGFDFSIKFWPIRKKDILKKIKCAPLAYPPPPKQKSATQISYSRGCPFKCDFCVSPIIFPGKVIYRDVNDVIREIKNLQKEFHINFLFFTDLTFNSYSKKVVELCEKIIDEKIDINWFCYCSMHLQENVIKKMVDAGCTRIGIGAESLVNRLLKDYKSQQTLDNIKDSLQLADKHGILNRVYLMLGYPEETKEMLNETFDKMKNLPIDQVRLAFITPFPGTPFYKKFESILTTKESEKFTGDYPVIKNENISPEEYIDFRDKMIIEFYNSNEYIEHVQDKCKRHLHLIESYRYFFKYLVDESILKETTYRYFNEKIR